MKPIIVGSGLAGLTAALKANTDIYSTDKPWKLNVIHFIPDFYEKGTLTFLKKHGIKLEPLKVLSKIVIQTENMKRVLYKKTYIFMRGQAHYSIENQLKKQLSERGLKIINKEIDFPQLDKNQKIIDATGLTVRQAARKFYGRAFTIKKSFAAVLIYIIRNFRGYIYCGPRDDGTSEVGFLSDQPILDETVHTFKECFFREFDFMPHHYITLAHQPLDLGTDNIFKIGDAAGLFDPFWFIGASNALRSAIYAVIAKDSKHYRRLMQPILKKITLTSKLRETLTAQKLEKLMKLAFWPFNHIFNVNYFKLLPLLNRL